MDVNDKSLKDPLLGSPDTNVSDDPPLDTSEETKVSDDPSSETSPEGVIVPSLPVRNEVQGSGVRERSEIVERIDTLEENQENQESDVIIDPRLEDNREGIIPDGSSTAPISDASRPPKIKAISMYMYILASFILSVSSYWLLVEQFSREKKTNGFVDALYIFVVTFSTVGYGDIFPSTELAKMISIVLVVNGIICLETMVSCAADLQERASYALTGNSKIDKLVSALCLVVMCILVGLLFLRFHEGLGWLDSIYFTVISVTTVGYGDISFMSLGGRFFGSIWILLSTISMACLLIRCGEMMKTEPITQLEAIVVTRSSIGDEIEDYLKQLKDQGRITDESRLQEIFTKIRSLQE